MFFFHVRDNLKFHLFLAVMLMMMMMMRTTKTTPQLKRGSNSVDTYCAKG